MKLKQVTHYPCPAYPTRAAVDEHPELLRIIPQRWHTNAAVLTALTATGLLFAGQQSLRAASCNTPELTYCSPLPGKEGRTEVQLSPAPISFVSEDDARKIITEEAEKAGITFKPDVQTVSALLPTTEGPTKSPNAAEVKKVAITLDGTDSRRHISYEYVSQHDTDNWTVQGAKANIYTTPAEHLREGMVQAGVPTGTYAVFYSPTANFGHEEDARLALRQQVRDFITWLKAQGII